MQTKRITGKGMIKVVNRKRESRADALPRFQATATAQQSGWRRETGRKQRTTAVKRRSSDETTGCQWQVRSDVDRAIDTFN